MPPSSISSFAAILRHRPTDDFVGAEIRTPEGFRFAQSAENKDSLCQMSGNPGFRILQPPFAAIEVDQQNHKSLCKTLHVCDVVRNETLQDPGPTACLLQHSDPIQESLIQIQDKAVGQLAVGIVFGKHQDVWLILV